MKSFIVKISEFFKISRDGRFTEDFDEDARNYIIPKYQREYKWTEEKVITLISDINNRDKFLGNVILDKSPNSATFYEIVDGQQRITTIYLILIALFNILGSNHNQEINLEQQNILAYLKKDDAFTLINESIGNYLSLSANTLKININPINDVYFQSETFLSLYDTIISQLSNIRDINSFIEKLLDCTLLVLISGNLGHSTSIEQIYLDINFKSQLLDIEDIFKGYCFKNYWPRFHNNLKEQWVELKKYSKEFEKIGYKDLSEFLYHYLLSKPDSYDIPKNLSPGGVHYLEDKNNDSTKVLLDDMIAYSKNVIAFWQSLNYEPYKFEDVCLDAQRYNTQDYKILKQMCKYIIENPVVQYSKFPLMMLIHYLKKEYHLKSSLTYMDLRKIITNYYVYNFLFINDGGRKQKGSIDRTVFEVLYGDTNQIIPQITNAVKELRKRYQVNYLAPSTFSLDSAYMLYSIIDNYVAADNFIPLIYSRDAGYNREHFIIHDNRGKLVKWVDGDDSFEFSLSDWDSSSNYKKSTVNNLILKEDINALLGHDDIVTKIQTLRSNCLIIPKHVNLFISYISELDSFKVLCELKGLGLSRDSIKQKYIEFVESYFEDDNQNILLQKIKNQFFASFRN